MRICSLSPSATDVALAIGLRDDLVAVTDQCEGVDDLPRVATTFVRQDAGSREIEELVSRHRSRWGTIFQVDEELLGRLEPDLILTQRVCEVCAVPAVFAHDTAGRIAQRAKALTFRADSVSDIVANIRTLGEAAGGSTERTAADLAERISAAVRRTRDRVGDLEPRRVFCLEWLDPVRSAGHWLPELAESAGGSVAHRGGVTTWDNVREFAPEIVIMMPCGWNINRIREEWTHLADRAGDARRVLSGARCWIADGSLCSRYGPGVLQTLETFASIVRPEIFGTPDARSAVPLQVGGPGQSTTNSGRER